MWLIPSQLSGFAPALLGSTKACAPDSNTLDSGIALHVSSSGTVMRRPCSWPGWRRRPWSRLLFGAVISRTSTAGRFVERWTESLRASRASRGATPDSGREPTTNAGSGRLLFGSSLTWDRDSSSWKTSQRSLLEEGLITCSVTLPRWGSMRNGCVSRREPLVLPIDASECSSWPTAQANDSEKRGVPSVNADQQTCLASAAPNWTTPNVPTRGIELSKEHRPDSGGVDLQSQVSQWQTPSAQTFSKRRQVGQESREELLLPAQATQWQSPGAMGGGSTSRGGDRIGEPLLAGQASQWGTPNAADGAKATAGTKLRQQKSLPADVVHNFSPPVPAPTGAESRNGSGRRLNPAFVCWLMGAPWFWTRAEPTSFGAAETESWRCALRRHLSSLFGEPDSITPRKSLPASPASPDSSWSPPA